MTKITITRDLGEHDADDKSPLTGAFFIFLKTTPSFFYSSQYDT